MLNQPRKDHTLMLLHAVLCSVYLSERLVFISKISSRSTRRSQKLVPESRIRDDSLLSFPIYRTVKYNRLFTQ